MIPWMLGRLEQSPDAVFSERELTASFPQDFERAKGGRLIRRAGGPPGVGHTGAYPHPSGRTYVVVAVEGGYQAFDEEDPEADPVTVTATELVRWTLDLAVFSEIFQKSNGLSGQPEAISGRLWFLGEREGEGVKVAYLLGLLDGGTSTMGSLESLPARLGSRYDRIVVVCPGYQPRIPERRLLETMGVTVTAMPEKGLLNPLAPKTGPVGQTTGHGFQHSPDYREVRLGEQRFDLTTNQARVVELLHQQHLKGVTSLGQGYILESLEIASSNLSQVFRRSPAWGALVVPAKGTGTYRLNLSKM